MGRGSPGPGDTEATQTMPSIPVPSRIPAPPPQIMRYGPGVPATPPLGQPRLTAERAWRGGRGSHAKPPPARDRRLGRILGWTLTVALLAASGVVLYLRFHTSPFHVTRAEISGQTLGGCGVDVTGRITTNGAAGTVHYQWAFRPDPHSPQP